MYIESDKIIFSPSDLTQFMDSPLASWMEHLAIAHPHLLPAPDKNDELLGVLHDMGNQHESEVLAKFEASGLTVANLNKRTDSYQATLDAMQKGINIIYQAHLEL